MALPNTGFHQWQTAGNMQGLTNSAATVRTDNILLNALPAPLAAPPGWRSQIIHSNSPLSFHTNVSTDNTFANEYDEDISTTESLNTTQLVRNANNNRYIQKSVSDNSIYHGQRSIGDNSIQHERFIDNRRVIQPVFNDNVSYHQQNTVLNEQQQQQIIQQVEHQQPPPLVINKRLPNNLVTYQQNISVRYLKPPTPPTTGPLIIRKLSYSLSNSKLKFFSIR